MLLRYWFIDKFSTVIWIITCIEYYQIISGQFVEYSPGQYTLDSKPKQDSDQFIKEYNREASEICNRLTTFEWRYAINSTDYNKRRMLEQKSISSKFECISWKKAIVIDLGLVSDTIVKRQYEKLYQQGRCGLGETKLMELQHILSIMKDNYNGVKICPYPGNRLTSQTANSPISQNYVTTFSSQPFTTISAPANYVRATTAYCDLKISEISRVMQKSRSDSELRYMWNSWRDITGPSIRNTFMRYIDLANQAARAQGFRDAGDQTRSAYDDNELYFTVQDLWYKVQPLYKQLFTFVRKGLYQYYGETIVRNDGPIPSHLLGDMWAQNWQSIMDIIKPGYRQMPDITSEMVRQGYTPLRIFQAAEEFFTSMGLPAMLPEFWRNSVLQKPNEIYTDCSMTSSWDFCNNMDFRIKQCTQITIDDYINAHREMTHIQYFMQYSSQPYIFREGPNPAFDQAISYAIGLSISNPSHLQKIGLLPKSIETETSSSMINIEYLLMLALQKLPLMAWSLSSEKWRWHVFEKGPIGMNGRWWELKLRYMGIIPTNRRSNEYFDAGAQIQMISDQDHIKYFISTVLEFQIFAELCSVSNHAGPLHTCDIYRSREAGKILMDVMQKGASLPSGQIISVLTKGKTIRLEVQPLLEFFRPLEAWLELQNRDEKIIGWNSNMDDVNLFIQPFYSSSTKYLLKHDIIMLGFFINFVFHIVN